MLFLLKLWWQYLLMALGIHYLLFVQQEDKAESLVLAVVLGGALAFSYHPFAASKLGQKVVAWFHAAVTLLLLAAALSPSLRQAMGKLNGGTDSSQPIWLLLAAGWAVLAACAWLRVGNQPEPA